MKKKIIISLMVSIFTLNTVIPAFAAPKQMSDGNMFDAEYYATNNPDVASVFGTDETMLYSHYINCGKIEGRKPYADGAVTTKFDAVYYATNNPDVVAILGTDETILYNHYITCGKNEGRIPCENGVPFMEVAPLEKVHEDKTVTTDNIQSNANNKLESCPYEFLKLYDNGGKEITFYYLDDGTYNSMAQALIPEAVLILQNRGYNRQYTDEQGQVWTTSCCAFEYIRHTYKEGTVVQCNVFYGAFVDNGKSRVATRY